MKTCTVCPKVKIKDKWKMPNKAEIRMVQQGLAQETVCPECELDVVEISTTTTTTVTTTKITIKEYGGNIPY